LGTGEARRRNEDEAWEAGKPRTSRHPR
jgi:hypothetical protein